MTETTRRSLLVAGAGVMAGPLAAPMIARPALAAETSWRLGHTAPASFPVHQRLLDAAAKVKQETSGRFEIEVVSDGRLGSQIGLLGQVRSGGLEMAMLTGEVLSHAQGLAGLPQIGFAWADHAALWKAMDGDLGKMIQTQVALRGGIQPLDTIWDFGFRVVTTTKKQIRSVGDLAGLRLRTLVDSDLVELFQALKAQPIAMPLSEMQRGLLRGALDGQESVVALVYALAMGKEQNYCALTNHTWDGQWPCVSPTAWRPLSENLRNVLLDAFRTAGLRQRAESVEQEALMRASLIKDGMTFNDVKQAEFRTALRATGYSAIPNSVFVHLPLNLQRANP